MDLVMVSGLVLMVVMLLAGIRLATTIGRDYDDWAHRDDPLEWR